MENPKIKVKIVHSSSGSFWKVVGTKLGGKYLIAKVPYVPIKDDSVSTEIQKSEALRHAKFIEFCFNNSDKVHSLFNEPRTHIEDLVSYKDSLYNIIDDAKNELAKMPDKGSTCEESQKVCLGISLKGFEHCVNAISSEDLKG